MPNVYVLPDQVLFECPSRTVLLSAALRSGVPFTHACGGHADCSTCRVVVVEGRNACSERSHKERAIAERLGFPPELRLACQTRINSDVTIRRLVLDDHDVELTDVRRRIRWKRRRNEEAALRLARRQPKPIGE